MKNKRIVVIMEPKDIEESDKLHGFVKTYVIKHRSLETCKRAYKDFRIGGIFYSWKIVSISKEL